MHDSPLDGVSVLVLRGGRAGSTLVKKLAQRGAEGVIAPVIRFGPPDDRDALKAAASRLRSGGYDWLVVTSATTVEVLVALEAALPAATKVAAVGPVTAHALRRAGFRVDLEPESDFSATGLLEAWSDTGGSVLLPLSHLAPPTVADGLRQRGMTVDSVVAYRTLTVELEDSVRDDVAQGRIHAALVTSASIAREVHRQLSPLPEGFRVVCIGAPSALAAREVGLRVDAVAQRADGESLVDALVELVA